MKSETVTSSLTDEQVLKAYVADPEKKELHIKMARMLSEHFKGKWFSVRDINTKTAVKNSLEASQMLFGLALFDLVISKEVKGGTRFRITLTLEQKIKVLEERKEIHLKEISAIDAEIEKLKARIVSK